LKQDLETIKKSYEVQCSKLELEAKDSKGLIKEVEDKNMEISTLKQELETIKKSYEAQCSKLESEVKDAKGELKQKSQEYEDLLEKLRNKLQESETLTKLKYEKWNMKQNLMQKAMNFQFGSIQVNLYILGLICSFSTLFSLARRIGPLFLIFGF
jgi:kinesin family protein C2/C3